MTALTDLRHALRLLGRSPLFTATALLSLGLGLAGTSAIYSVADALLGAALVVVEDRDVEAAGLGLFFGPLNVALRRRADDVELVLDLVGDHRALAGGQLVAGDDGVDLGQPLVGGRDVFRRVSAGAGLLIDQPAGEAAPGVDQGRGDFGRTQVVENPTDALGRGVPRFGVALLGTDVERDPDRVVLLGRTREQVHRHLGTAAELARQRPIGSAAIGHDATKECGTRRRLDELVELGITVEREQANGGVLGLNDRDQRRLRYRH